MFDAEYLAMIAGVVTSLAFSYAPGLKGWFENLDGNYKRLVMLGVMFLASAALLGLSCVGYYEGLTCDQPGVVKAIEVFIAAAIANQTAYALTPKKVVPSFDN